MTEARRKRFASQVTPSPGGCHIWRGTVHPWSGYGMFYCMGESYAHRVAYRWAHEGEGPPEGMVVSHTCGQRLCVKPEHLKAVPRGASTIARSNPPSWTKYRFTEEELARVREGVEAGRTVAEVAKSIGRPYNSTAKHYRAIRSHCASGDVVTNFVP